MSTTPWPAFTLAGATIGVFTGLFGVGGSSIATPLLSIMGVPGLVAVASPLPAAIPSAIAAAAPYVRQREARPRAAAWSLIGAAPAAVGGALLSQIVGGSVLLFVSGVVLVIVGQRVTRPISETTKQSGTGRRLNRPFLVGVMAGVGLFSGLLANGGGFLIVPAYLLIFGLDMRQATGTSLLVISVLTVPTLVTHWALGHIDWTVAGAFALGATPASAVSSHFSRRVGGDALRRAFGWFLTAAGVAFVAYRLVVG